MWINYYAQISKIVLESELHEARVKLEAFERLKREEEEQDKLSAAIWGCKRQPDATWDAQPVLLTEVDKPVTVGRIAGELGVNCLTPASVPRLCAQVHQAYVRARGKAPIPVVYYDKDGVPERVSCYTERDRELITGVIREQACCL